jgi:hypothetical protein
MNKKMAYCCDLMASFLDDIRIPLVYSPIYREYSIPLLYKGKTTALQRIFYCPWCNTKLPTSLRSEWFSILKDEYNLDDPWDKEEEKLVPGEFKTDEWWIKRKL